MKKKQLASQNKKEIDDLTEQMAAALEAVNKLEANGQFDTYYHQKYERLAAELAAIQNVNLED